MKKGFTLIELLVVISIVALIVAISIPLYAKYTNKAFRSTVISDVRNTVNAVESFITDFTTLPNPITCPSSGFGPYTCALTDGTNTLPGVINVSKGVSISYQKATGACGGADTYKVHGIHQKLPGWGFCFDACRGRYAETDGTGCP